MRPHELARKLVRRFEDERVEVTVESVEQMNRVLASNAAMLDEARADEARAIATLSPDQFDCVEHGWQAPRCFPGEPKMPESLVKSKCPDCKRETEERAQPRKREVLYDDHHFHRERVAISENPQVVALYRANLLRFKGPSEPLPGSEQEKDAVERLDDLRRSAIARDRETAATRRRRHRAYWAKKYGVSAGEGNWRANVNAIHAGRT